MIEITELKEATQKAITDINVLLPQLRTHTNDETEFEASLEELATLVGSDSAALVVAMDGTRIVGMATLYILPKFCKRVGIIEDVVVDSAYRGQHLGERIMNSLIEYARANGLKTLSLTSRPDRVAAHHLYEKLGFTKKETDVFRLTL